MEQKPSSLAKWLWITLIVLVLIVAGYFSWNYWSQKQIAEKPVVTPLSIKNTIRPTITPTIKPTVTPTITPIVKTIGPGGGEIALKTDKCSIKVSFPPKFINQETQVSLKENSSLPLVPNPSAKLNCPFSIIFNDDPKIKYASNLYDDIIPMMVTMNVGSEISQNRNYIMIRLNDVWVTPFRESPVQQNDTITQEIYVVTQKSLLELDLGLVSMPIVKYR